jgi:signal peptidase
MALNNNLGKKPLNFKREIIDTLKFILSVVIIIGIGFVVINYVPFIAKYNHYIIATNSMEPIINVGDVVIVDSGINLDDLKKDQIIAFYADIRGDGRKVVVVHYLDSVSEVDGVRIFRTRPEINDSIDPWKLKDEDIIGNHKLTIPKIGPVLLFAQSTMGRIVLIIDVVVIYVILLILLLIAPMLELMTSDAINKSSCCKYAQY